MNTNNYILSIAGFDPSSGAGLTSDIKTFEAFDLYGLSVCTAVTVQNDINFKASHWVKPETIIHQIETLFERFSINVVKIGIVENWETVRLIVNTLKTLNPNVKIILDPVLKASSGYNFHTKANLSVLDKVLDHIFIITPNYNEIKGLYPDKNISDTIEYISAKTNIYLKGGHRTDKKGWDELYHSKIVQCNIPPISDNIFNKHGSGCVLSSALASNLALDYSLEDAAFKTKAYVEDFLNSNKSLLGVHKYKTYSQKLDPN